MKEFRRMAKFTPLTGLLEHLYTEVFGWNEYLATALNMLLNFITEFLYQRFFVFGKTVDTRSKGKKTGGE